MNERRRWEDRYGASAPAPRAPSALLASAVAMGPRGRALDLACGDGRNALFLARRGFVVDAVDLAYAALRHLAVRARREGVAVHSIQADLERWPLPDSRYGIVVNTRYLQRSLFASMRRAVAPGGVVVFETFLRQQAEIGHPRNPNFLLEAGELRHQFEGFDFLLYEEGLHEEGDGGAFLARMMARRPGKLD